MKVHNTTSYSVDINQLTRIKIPPNTMLTSFLVMAVTALSVDADPFFLLMNAQAKCMSVEAP